MWLDLTALAPVGCFPFEEFLAIASFEGLGFDFIKRHGWIPDLKCQQGFLRGRKVSGGWCWRSWDPATPAWSGRLPVSNFSRLGSCVIKVCLLVPLTLPWYSLGTLLF